MNKIMLKNPSFSTSPEVREIANEYFCQLNLTLHYFGHGTVFPDGRHYCLNSNSNWAEWHLIEREQPPGGYTIYDQIDHSIHLPKMDSGNNFGWSDEATRLAKDRFGIENPMIIFQKYDNRLESFFFDLRHEKAHEKFINHFDIFENFIFYYKDKAKDLLKKARENPLIVPEKYFNPAIHSKKTLTSNEKMIFDPEGIAQGNKPLPKQYSLSYLNHNYSISTREYQCLSLLAHGAKIKNIAEALNLSPRTIETHLNSLKKKLQTNSLTRAIEIYWKNRIQLR